jgi:hypothetical protein
VRRRRRSGTGRRVAIVLLTILTVIVVVGLIVDGDVEETPPDAGGSRPSGTLAVLDATFTITGAIEVSGRFTDEVGVGETTATADACAAYARKGVGTTFVSPAAQRLPLAGGYAVTIEVAATGYTGPGDRQRLGSFGVGNDFRADKDGRIVALPMTEEIEVTVAEDGSGELTVRGRDTRAPGRPVDTLTLRWTCRPG